MRHRNTERKVNVKRLRIFFCAHAYCWVTNMPYRQITFKALHVAIAKNITHHTVLFSQVKHAVKRQDAGGVLTTVLKCN